MTPGGNEIEQSYDEYGGLLELRGLVWWSGHRVNLDGIRRDSSVVSENKSRQSCKQCKKHYEPYFEGKLIHLTVKVEKKKFNTKHEKIVTGPELKPSA